MKRRDVYIKALELLKKEYDKSIIYYTIYSLCDIFDTVLGDEHHFIDPNDMLKALTEFALFKPDIEDDSPFWWHKSDYNVREIVLLFCIEMCPKTKELKIHKTSW